MILGRLGCQGGSWSWGNGRVCPVGTSVWSCWGKGGTTAAGGSLMYEEEVTGKVFLSGRVGASPVNLCVMCFVL